MPDEQNFRPSELQPAITVVTPVPDHELIRLIGKGSYGEVWLARNTLGTCRAVKIVHENTFRHKRPFEREFNGVQKFEPVSRLHEGLMDVLQVGRNETAGYFYCVIELADDIHSGPVIDPHNYSPRTLASEIAGRKRLPIEECRRMGITIASALNFLHGRGLIHRDIKPSNLVFVNGIPKLADIGLVVEMSEAKSYVGTEGFIPPEGPGTIQSDIYSLGKVLYEISTGKDRHDYPELPTELGGPMEEDALFKFHEIVVKACRADPRQRYKSAGAMVADLLALPGGGPPPSRIIARRGFTRMHRVGVAIVCLGISSGLLFRVNRNATRIPASTGTRVPSALAPASRGLIGWWQAESNGVDSVNGNHGSVNNGVTFVPGKVGQAFNFDGTYGYVRIADAPILKPTNLTVAAWVRFDSLNSKTSGGAAAGSQHIVFKQGANSVHFDGYSLNKSRDRNGDFFEFEVGSELGEIVAIRSSSLIQTSHWYHVVAVRGPDFIQLYTNGQIADWTMVNFPQSYSNAPLYFGATCQSWDGRFKGSLDEVRIYNVALSSNEIVAAFSAGQPGK